MENTKTLTTQEQASRPAAANDQTPSGIRNTDISSTLARNTRISPQVEPISEGTYVSYAEHSYISDVTHKPISWIIDEIRSSPELKEMIEKVRAEKHPDERQKLKKKLLPYFTFSHFVDNKRDNAHFKFTKFILVDLDHVGVRMEELKKAFRSDSHIFLFFVSPSGDGLKVVFALTEYIEEGEAYKKAYAHFQNVMKKQYETIPDASTFDEARCCFLSCDPDLYVNWNALRLDVPKGENEPEAEYNLTERKGDEKILQLMEGVVAPGRHLATTTLTSFYKNKRMDYTATLATLKGWNLKNSPPLDEEELDKIVSYVFKKENYGNRKNIEVDPAEIHYDDVANLQVEPIIYTPNLVTGWMKTVGINLLSGTEGSGKSILAMNLSLCVCLGEEFLGRTVRPGKVLYLDNEVDREEFKDRLHHMNRPVPPDTFHILFDAPVMEAKYVEEKIAEFKPSLVVIDSFYLATTAKEKDNDALKAVLGELKTLVHKYQCVILVITHFHKGTKYDKLHMDMTVGGGAQNRIVNGAFLMRRSDKDESMRIIKADKLRGFDDDERNPRLLSFDKATFTFHDEGLVDEEHHIAHLGEKKMEKIDVLGIFKSAGKTSMSRDEIIVASEDLGYSIPTVDRAIKRGTVEGKLLKEKHGTYAVALPVTAPIPVADNNDKGVVDIER